MGSEIDSVGKTVSSVSSLAQVCPNFTLLCEFW